MKYIAIPNSLICDRQLTPADRKVALALLSFRWESKQLKKSLRFIAERANVCVNTVRAAISKLEAAGFLTRKKNYRYDREQRCVVYDAASYTLRAGDQGNYTLLPYTTVRTMLAADMTPSAFLTFLLLAMKQGQNHDHAWPSLHGSAREVGLAKSTICRAISVLADKLFLLRLRGKKAIGGFFCNSYYVIINVTRRSLHPSGHQEQHITPDTASQGFFSPKGGSIFDKPPINNITQSFRLWRILRGKTNISCYIQSTVNRTRRPCAEDKSALARFTSAVCNAIRHFAQKFSLSKRGQQGEKPQDRLCKRPTSGGAAPRPPGRKL